MYSDDLRRAPPVFASIRFRGLPFPERSENSPLAMASLIISSAIFSNAIVAQTMTIFGGTGYEGFPRDAFHGLQ